MAGVYNAGETKLRPGLYYRIENGGGEDLAAAPIGTVAVVFKANWGPLNQIVNIGSTSEIYKYFGDDAVAGSNTDILRKVFAGGAFKIRAVRVGAGGTPASVALKDTAATPVGVITLTAKHPGNRNMAITIKDSLADPEGKRECVIFSGTRTITKVEFAKGADEINALVELHLTHNFLMRKEWQKR